jgi:transcription elongation factor GreA
MAEEINRYKMSPERYEKLKQELEKMETVDAKNVSEQIKEARSFGDLSENSEYDEAKNEQGKLYSKIAETKDLIEHAIIVENVRNGSGVSMGSKVTVREIGEDEDETYEIVGSQEANPIMGSISDESPIGRALLGHCEGEKIDVETPGGVVHYEIISVEY